MLQKQYYESKLNSSQLDRIVSNYNIKYTSFQNEINYKITSLIKSFLKDISSFLENIQEINNEKEKLKEFTQSKKQIDLLSEELKKKTQNEIKLKKQIETLNKEISKLKRKNGYKKSRSDTIEDFLPNLLSKDSNEDTEPKHKKQSSTSISLFIDNDTYSSKYKTSKVENKSNRLSGKGFSSKSIEKEKSNSDNYFIYKEPKIITNITNIIKEINQDQFRYSYHKKNDINNEESNNNHLSKKEMNKAQKFINVNNDTEQYKTMNKVISQYDSVLQKEIEELENEEKRIKELLRLIYK